MQGFLLAVVSFLVVFVFHRHQTDSAVDERTNTLYANNKLKKTTLESNPENHGRGKNWRKKLHNPTVFLRADLADIRDLRDEENLASEKTVVAEEMDVWAKKTRQNQQKSEMAKVRSHRQRRTAQTPETTLVCEKELSCRNRCQNPRTVLYQTQFSCFCDEDCEFFLDCCADYHDFCGTNGLNMTNSTGHNRSLSENLVNQQNRNLWRCYEGEYVPGTNGVWMIGLCPSSWPEDDVLYRCRNLSSANTITKDNYRYLPVYTNNGRVYHNRFCAECNGVVSSQLTEFPLSIDCDFTPPRHLSFENTLSYLFSYCTRTYPSNEIYFSPWKGDPRRYCLYLRQVSDCVSTFNIDANMTLTKCLTHKLRIVTSGFFYKNADCAKCDNPLSNISCGPNFTNSFWKNVIPTPFKHLTFIFDFKNNNSKGLDLMQIKIHDCPSELVYDYYLDICRDAIPALPRISDVYEYEVAFRLQRIYDTGSYIFLNPSQEAIAIALAVPIHQVKNFNRGSAYYTLMITLQIPKNESLQGNVRNILHFTSPFNITVDGMSYTVVKADKRVLSCVNRQRYDRSEYTVLQDGSSTVVIKKTGEVFQFTDYYINTTETSTSANDNQAIFVCRHHQISNCSGVYILINEGEFRVLMNKSIFVNALKQVYNWSEYTWINKSVLVCENFSTIYYQSKVVPKDDPLLTTITIVCMSLSIIGLVFVLVTYSLFSELRTPPGINLMNLSVSILLAQLLWLLGSGQTDTPMACTVIAVILHYLFLVSFVWTSIIAFDTWRAFSAENNAFRDSNREKCIKVLRHVAVGWLPALVYVGICVGLDFTDTVTIGYKSRIACWMANKWAILYFFAVPVFVFLVFNIMFCVMTFRAIKVTTAQARAAPDHEIKMNFGIYVCISSIMGFMWIFGFVAPFGWQFLLYPFVILNGLQGVYIALAFALNKRARGLYKRWFKGRSPPNETSNTSVSNTNIGVTDNENSADTKL